MWILGSRRRFSAFRRGSVLNSLAVVLVGSLFLAAGSSVPALAGPVLNSAPFPFFDGSFYELRSPPLDWEDANSTANAATLGTCASAHLATVTSAAEQQVITGLLTPSSENAWMGGFQLPGEMSLDQGWQWVTGEPFVYTNWAGGEPNDRPFGPYEPGSEQHLEPLSGSGDWNDAPGFEPKLYIIEHENCPHLIARAGPDQHVNVSDMVTLDGSGSFDVEDSSSQLTYLWEQIPGPDSPQDSVTLTVPNPGAFPGKAKAKFLASPNTNDPIFSPVRSYAFRLTVTDTDGNSATDEVVVTALENLAKAVFVSATFGNDGDDGSMEFPVKTLEQAFSLANATSPRSDIYIHAKGYLVGSTLIVRNNMSLYGGFDVNPSPIGKPEGWTRTASTPTLIIGAPTAVRVLNISTPTTIDGLTIQSADGAPGALPSGRGQSSISIRVSNAGEDLSITNNIIEAGRGRSGAGGADGVAGEAGGDGGDGITVVTPPLPAIGSPGAGGGSPCGPRGGNGGLGGFALVLPTPGFGGGPGDGGTPGGSGGAFIPAFPPGFHGLDGGRGSNGTNGSRGAGGSPGGDGGAGGDGNGGGGGGGGGGGILVIYTPVPIPVPFPPFVIPIFFPTPVPHAGGHGAGGGGGGCGGESATGGKAGGHSYGIHLNNATPRIMGNTFTTAGGGTGGSGGRGGRGGRAGSGGNDSFQVIALSFRSGQGGDGGRGGFGAGGGGGGGGQGGNSCGIFLFAGSAPALLGNVYGAIVPPGFLTDSFIGLPGAGGFGGMGGSAPAGAPFPNQVRGINGAFAVQGVRARVCPVETVVQPAPITVGPAQTVSTNATVPMGISTATFESTWGGSDVVMTLIPPSGPSIGRGTSDPNVVHLLGPTFESYRITNPQAGAWTIELFGDDVPSAGELVDVSISAIPTNQPPVADAGPELVVRCGSPSGRLVTLDGSASSDPDGDGLTFEWKDAGNNVVGSDAQVPLTLPVGTHTFSLTVNDSNGGISSDSVTVTVDDATPPVLTLFTNLVTITIPMAASNGASANLSGVALATDTCDPSVTVSNDAPGLFPLGRTEVTFTATDDSGNSTQSSLIVHVVYDFGGFRPPIEADGSSVYQVGDDDEFTIGVEFELAAANGDVIPDALATLELFSIDEDGTLDPVEIESSDDDNEGDDEDGDDDNGDGSVRVRFDEDENLYSYDLAIDDPDAGTYLVVITLDDETLHSITFTLVEEEEDDDD